MSNPLTLLTVVIVIGLLSLYILHRDHELGLHLMIERIHKVEQSAKQLEERVRSIEELKNLSFTRGLRHETPPPLKQVYCFKFWLHPSFWNALNVSPAETEYAFAHGYLPTGLVIEEWGSHAVVRIEKGPVTLRPSSDGPSAVIQLLPMDHSLIRDSVTIWELPFGSSDSALNPAPRLELRLQPFYGSPVGRDAHLKLFALNGQFGVVKHPIAPDEPKPEYLFFEVPLQEEELAEFKEQDDDPKVFDGMGYKSYPWSSVYRHNDKSHGVEWYLWVRDVARYRCPDDDPSSPTSAAG